MRRTLAVLVLSLALPATATATAAPTPPLEPVAVMPWRTTATSAAWQDTAGTHVLRDDQPLGGETVLSTPPGCDLGALTAADVAYDCASDGPDRFRVWLQDRGTTALHATAIAYERSGGAGESYRLSGIGTALGAIYTDGGPHVDAFTQYRRLADGRGIATPRPSAHRVVSLDAPSGTVKLCAPLSVGTHEVTAVDDFFGDEYTYTSFDQTLYRAPWLVTVRHGRVLLKRCGSRTVRDLGPAYAATLLFLTRRYVVWATEAFAGSWRVHRFADHATFRYAPALDQYGWRIAGTDHRLWIGDARGNAYMITP